MSSPEVKNLRHGTVTGASQNEIRGLMNLREREVHQGQSCGVETLLIMTDTTKA